MRIQNAKGQIAIFVVLIFQVLFILFAMTINIALVVHDKINFQNSLDMAVYYGAKQQAEVLNSMAHINYQMRQNWKLLAWRYRILGTLTQDNGWHEDLGAKEYWCPQNTDENVNCAGVPAGVPAGALAGAQQACNQARSRLPYTGGYCDSQYFSCISHDLWKRGVNHTAGQNLCEKVDVYIPPVTPLQIVPSAVFFPFTQLAAGGVNQLIGEVTWSCPREGALNWLMTQFFLTHFRLDQRDRKSMMREIFNRSLKLGKDLDGKSIFEGAKKVFFNNLSSANRKNAQSLPDYGLKDFNSFQDETFDSIFEPVDVWPVLQFLHIFVTTSPPQNPLTVADCTRELRPHFNPEHTSSNFSSAFDTINGKFTGHALHGHLQAEQKYLFQFNYGQNAFQTSASGGGDPIKSLILGFVKNKEKTLYYGLTGALKYLPQNQIFSLILTPHIEFKGSAFAKAFGGRFGPQPHQMDHLIPVHYPGASIQIPSSSVNVFLLQPNHSRWPGDKWGLIARKLHDNEQSNPYSNFLNKQAGYSSNRQRAYTIESFFHLIFYPGLADDPLSRPRSASNMGSNFMRMMELMALYPDVYDLSYYSISGNYMQTYFPRICKLLKGGDCQHNARNQIANFHASAYIRGDFGWPETDYYIGKNQSEKRVDLSIAPYFLKGGGYNINPNEITVPPDDTTRSFPAIKIGRNLPALTQGRIFYPWLAQELPDHLLSSWASTIAPEKLNYDAYQLSSSSFLKCPHKALANMPVPSACAGGGRSGYSVKLISCEIAASLSSHPAPINEYCP